MPSYADEYEEGSATLGGLEEAASSSSDQTVYADPVATDASASAVEVIDASSVEQVEEDPLVEGVEDSEAEALAIGSIDGSFYSLEVVNNSGHPVDYIDVKASAAIDWQPLPIEMNLAWANSETAEVSLPDLRATVDASLMESVGNDSLYDLRLTVAGSTYELHSLCFDCIEDAVLLWDAVNGVYYLEMNRSDGTMESTLEAELAYIAAQNASSASEAEDVQPEVEVTEPSEEPVAAEEEVVEEEKPADEAEDLEGVEHEEEESADADQEEGEDASVEEDDQEDDEASEEEELLISVQEAEELTGIETSKEGLEYAEGEVLVFLEDGTLVSEISEILHDSPVSHTDEVSRDNMVAARIHGDEISREGSIDPFVVVDVESDVAVSQAVAMLSSKPGVAEVTPNYIFEAHGSEDDAPSGSDVDASNHTYDSYIDMMNAGAEDSVSAIEAWSRHKSNHSIAVAVIDTGCNTAHEDLANNIIATYNSVDGSSDVTDNHGHGTHVAGIACAEAGNGIGVAGSSYNADLVVVKASYTGPSGTDGDFKTSTLLGAINWIIANKDSFASPIRVINLSLGSVGAASTLMGNSLCKAIDSARAAGILVVASAGNSSSATPVPTTCYPADYDACLSVINLNSPLFSSRHANSNYNAAGVTASTVNATKDICAPGTQIMSTSSDGSYKSMTGTSMAAPVVSGIAALCFSANPSLTPDDVVAILQNTATDLGSAGWDSETGYGRIDANAALMSILGEDSKTEGSGDSNLEDSSALISVQIPVAEEGLEWTGEDIEGVSVDANFVDIEGNVASSAGKHTATASLKEGCIWSDGTTEVKQIEWMIEPIELVDKPSYESEFAYDGTQKRVVSASEYYFVSDTADAAWDSRDDHSADGTATDPGDYVSYVILKPGYAWDDCYSDPLQIDWSISQGVLKASNVTLSGTEFKYTGSAIKPAVKVVFSGETLTQGVDYTLTYSNNVNSGTASVKVVGKGAFAGCSVTKTFKILALYSMEDATCTIAYTAVMKTGSAIKPKITVKHDGETLTSGTHYTVTYKNNVNAGLASAVITGKGAYGGSVTKTFRIFNKFSGWYEYSGKWYYGVDGTLASGWRSISNDWYYFYTASKAMATGVVKISGKYYYLNSSGAQQTGWVKTGGYWYYFGASGGAACIGWKSIGGEWYYFYTNGRMATGTVTIDGVKYYFDSSGAMQ